MFLDKLKRWFRVYLLRFHLRRDALYGKEVSLTVDGEVVRYRPMIYQNSNEGEKVDYCFSSNFDPVLTDTLKEWWNEWIEECKCEVDGHGIFSLLGQANNIRDKAFCLTRSEILVVPAWLPITEEVALEIRIAERMTRLVKFVSHWELENNSDTLIFLISKKYGLFGWSKDLFFCSDSRNAKQLNS